MEPPRLFKGPPFPHQRSSYAGRGPFLLRKAKKGPQLIFLHYQQRFFQEPKEWVSSKASKKKNTYLSLKKFKTKLFLVWTIKIFTLKETNSTQIIRFYFTLKRLKIFNK
jgi:hypothetical protein